MSISLAMVFPLVLTLILLTVQGALWWYDRQIALSAARQGSEAARSFQADPDAGETAANTFLDQVGDGLTERHVTVSPVTAGVRTVTTTVTVRTQSLLPFLPGILITQTIEAPVERFVPATP
ncbi:TadE/TadG family type IV pilus assembly protein [Streptacidiphilus sp. N1-12]|uniref:TadE/TadG family type IV pilus assembly protein n=2 Tax=Streptacidiphilus alkalitolerans TaxID=3342712 RepID=A0ABV6VDD7_9ACTN